MPYNRMQYAHERREWIKQVDEMLPQIEAHASTLQIEAQMQWENWQKLPLAYQAMPFTRMLIRDCYDAARAELMRCIYYKAMREANRDD